MATILDGTILDGACAVFARQSSRPKWRDLLPYPQLEMPPPIRLRSGQAFGRHDMKGLRIVNGRQNASRSCIGEIRGRSAHPNI